MAKINGYLLTDEELDACTELIKKMRKEKEEERQRKKNMADIFIYMGFDIPKCPIDDYTCPYYNKESGRCIMDAEEGVPPYDECDAFYEFDVFYDLEEEE